MNTPCLQTCFQALCVFVLAVLAVVLGWPLLAGADPVQELRIADRKGDWGSPNPYCHYPRGPGYIRMSWVFDTLVWKDREGYIPARYTEPEAFIGSSPYTFENFNKAQGTYLYKAFADYYQGRPRAKRLIYVRTGKPMISLRSGQVDLAGTQPDMVTPLKRQGLQIIRDERDWDKKLMINHRKEPFQDRRSGRPWPMPSAGSRSSTERTGDSGLRPPMDCCPWTTPCTTQTPRPMNRIPAKPGN